jgi:pyruvate/2-oxoglutarate dehydrogenase complex dihydrolipoamide dehydrogenase (E3) component/uncharacterized membrane protein YdjX (TVP38/TMEM64 family)
MKAGRILVVLVIVALAAAFFAFGGQRYLGFEAIKAQQAALAELYRTHPAQTLAAFGAAYVAVTALSLPGAALMTLLAGAIFGLLAGTVVVSFASSIGATLAFLASRYLLRDWVQARFGTRLAGINEGVAKEGGLYLFTLRLIPVLPFFAINLLMGLTPIRTGTFYLVSQLGMFAGTVVYVNAGTELARITSLQGIVSPGLLGAFVLLGLFPLLAKKAVDIVKARRVYARWAHLKPRVFDTNVLVIGAGSGGLVTAYIAAAVKAKVTLVEKHKMGGDCLNTGCVPSKALIRSAKFLSHVKRSREFGIEGADARFDFADVMSRVQEVVAAIEPHDSVARYTSLGVDVVEGAAKITSPWTVQVTADGGATRNISARSIVIAAGARPLVPPIPGLAGMQPLTSDTVWNLRALPKRLLVLGGGPIGCELAQAFARFGTAVTQVEMAPRLMLREDPEVSEMVMRQFRAEGVDVRVGHKAKEFRLDNGVKTLVAEHDGSDVVIAFDEVLCALGRTPNVSGYGLEELGIPVTRTRTVETNEYLETLYPNIFACGDVAGPYQFTHTAAHQAWYAAVNALFGTFRRFKADYSVIPWATFTEPEVARVGLNESEAREKGIAYQSNVYGIDDLDRAIADSEAHGMVKVLTRPGSDHILGVTIVGEHAGDLIAEYVMAMKHGLGLNKILGTIHIYPTLAEANKYAAGVWKRGTVTMGQHAFLAAFQAWRRGAGGLGAVLSALFVMGRDKRPAYGAEHH